MINISIDEKDKHVLRVTASYFLALAGDIKADIVNESTGPTIDSIVAEAIPRMERAAGVGPGFLTGQLILNDPDVTLEIDQPRVPSAAEVFGGKSAPSTAAADPSQTALADTPASTSTGASNVPAPPAPPPANSAPPAAPPPPNPANGVELDKHGLPWDGRIHSREKTKLKDGAWKYKRGVSDEEVNAVEAQLRGVMAIPAPATTDAPPPPPPPPSDPSAPPPPQPAPATEGPTFSDFMQKVSEAVAAQKTSQVAVVATIKRIGIENLALLNQRPDLIPQAMKAIDDLIDGIAS